MNSDLIQKTEKFLKETFDNSEFLRGNPVEKAYRLEHSYRVSNIGRQIAEAEGMDVTEMVIACLLHDIAYCQDIFSPELRRAHGRLSAKIAQPFLETLDLPEERKNDILYGIAIHVDGEADFLGRTTAFAETVGDADNIDRFDAYRIYEMLQYDQFSKMPLPEKTQYVAAKLERFPKLRQMQLATQTATALWQQKIDFSVSFYEKLQMQLENSTSVF